MKGPMKTATKLPLTLMSKAHNGCNSCMGCANNSCAQVVAVANNSCAQVVADNNGVQSGGNNLSAERNLMSTTSVHGGVNNDGAGGGRCVCARHVR